MRSLHLSRLLLKATVLMLVLTIPSIALAQADVEELAKKLANPVSSLISVPFQFNFDRGIGPSDDGKRYAVNIQPVVPFSMNQDWNLISRTILPVVGQNDIFAGAGAQFGLGDIIQSVFFSPASPTSGGLVWGAGPVALLPTGTDDLLGTEKWGLGPTVVVLKQQGPWTYGALVNHIWSVAGDDNRSDINSTLLQPFLSYTTREAWSFALSTESTRDWEAEQWAVPINATVSKVIRVGGQTLSISGGVRYWAASAETGPEGFGLRAQVTFLFPRP